MLHSRNYIFQNQGGYVFTSVYLFVCRITHKLHNGFTLWKERWQIFFIFSADLDKGADPLFFIFTFYNIVRCF